MYCKFFAVFITILFVGCGTDDETLVQKEKLNGHASSYSMVSNAYAEADTPYFLALPQEGSSPDGYVAADEALSLLDQEVGDFSKIEIKGSEAFIETAAIYYVAHCSQD